MPSAGGAGLALPKGSKWLVPSRDSFKGIESSFVGGVGGAKSFATRYGDDAGRGIKGLFNFGKKAPTSGGVRPNPAQATSQLADDFVRAQSPTATSPPVQGRAGSWQVPRPLIYGGLAAGGIALAPRAGEGLRSIGAGAGAGAAAAIQPPLTALGAGFTDAFSGLGAGLANGLAGIGAGTGVGVSESLKGVGEGLKAIMIPALLLGGGFLVFTALKK